MYSIKKEGQFVVTDRFIRNFSKNYNIYDSCIKKCVY